VEGFSPFQRSGPLPTLTAVLTADLPPYEHAGPLVPVLEGLLHRDAAARPDVATARAMLADLTRPGSASDEPAATRPVDVPESGPTLAGPPPGDRLRRGPLLAGLAAVLLLAVVAGLLYLVRSGDDPDPAAAPGRTVGDTVAPTRSGPTRSQVTSDAPATSAPRTSASASPSRSATTGGSPGAAATGLPAGYRQYRDSSGFGIAVPAGWVTERRGGRVYLRDPGSSRYLLVDQTDDPKGDPYQDWLAQEPAVKRKLAGYRRVSIEPLDFKGWPGADWEFTWNTGSRRLHVLNRNLVTGPDKAYALYWSVPDAGWDADLARFRTMAATFTPAS
jgi:hypothetical protein